MINKQLLITFVVNCIIFITICNAQPLKSVNVKFEIKDKKVDFSNEVKIKLTVNNIQIEPLMFVNGFVVPDFNKEEDVDVCFTYNNTNYTFTKLSILKFDEDWIFGVVKKPSDKTIQKEYYLKFIPKNGGIVTMVKVKIKK